MQGAATLFMDHHSDLSFVYIEKEQTINETQGAYGMQI